jgi:large conductance mechanosensitive channel
LTSTSFGKRIAATIIALLDLSRIGCIHHRNLYLDGFLQKGEMTMSLLTEFRDFINRGNVVDLAVAVVIGAAFTGIVNSLVADLITPIIGVLTGGINFSGLSITVGEAVIGYGNFIQAVFNFLIIAFAVFWLVKAVNQFRRKEKQEKPAEPAAPTTEEALLTEIRDLLKVRVDLNPVDLNREVRLAAGNEGAKLAPTQ